MESKLEPALFYLRVDGKLKGVLVTHVDDIEGGLHPSYLQKAFQKSSQALEFATDLLKDFIFRGREIRQTEQGHIDVSMRNYALAMKPIRVDAVRKKQLSSDLTAEELELMHSSAGELGWITRQLRCDLAYENGVVQRSKSDACVADLVKLKQLWVWQDGAQISFAILGRCGSQSCSTDSFGRLRACKWYPGTR